MIPRDVQHVPDFHLVTKWVSRKLAGVLAFYLFTANVEAPAKWKIAWAAAVTVAYLVINVVQKFVEKNYGEAETR